MLLRQGAPLRRPERLAQRLGRLERWEGARFSFERGDEALDEPGVLGAAEEHPRVGHLWHCALVDGVEVGVDDFHLGGAVEGLVPHSEGARALEERRS